MIVENGIIEDIGINGNVSNNENQEEIKISNSTDIVMVERVEEDSKEETKEIPLLNKINNEGDEIVFELSSLIA